MADSRVAPELRSEDLDGVIAWTVIRAARRCVEHLTGVLADYRLTPVQFGVLAQLTVEPLLTQSELARRIHMRPQSMNHLLDSMIERGVLERTTDRGKGRRNPVRLSSEGRELFAVVWPVVGEANSASALGLPAEQLDDLNRLLHQMLPAG